MEKFITENWAIAATVINLLAGIVVALGLTLIRVQFRHIDDHQQHQDRRLGVLEDDVNSLKGDRRATTVELRHLSKLVEQHFEELKDYKKTNDEDHREIKALIRNQQPRTT